MKYDKMPGPKAVLHNEFAVWMARRNMSVRFLAGVLGCSHSVINNIRHGQKMPGPIRKLLLMFYRDCPVTALNLKFSNKPLQAPTAANRPNMAISSPLAKFAKSLKKK